MKDDSQQEKPAPENQGKTKRLGRNEWIARAVAAAAMREKRKSGCKASSEEKD